MENHEFIIQTWHIFAFIGTYLAGMLTVVAIVHPIVKRGIKEAEEGRYYD